MLRALYHFLSPRGPRGRLSVLMFHRVAPAPDPLQPDLPDAAEFDDMMRWVASWFAVIPLADAIARLNAGALPARALSVTFDDGYADNESVALPILQRHRLHATFFVATGFLDGGRMWNDTVIETVRRCAAPQLDLTALGLGVHALHSDMDRRSAIGNLLSALKYRPMPERLRLTEAIAAAARVALPHDLMMSSEQVRKLRKAGMEIGAHTVNHPILTALDASEAHYEIVENKAALEDLLGEPVRLFAYPNGKPGSDYSREHVAIVKKLGFAGAVSTAWGAARKGTDVYQIPRFTPWDRTALKFGARMALNLTRSRYETV